MANNFITKVIKLSTPSNNPEHLRPIAPNDYAQLSRVSQYIQYISMDRHPDSQLFCEFESLITGVHSMDATWSMSHPFEDDGIIYEPYDGKILSVYNRSSSYVPTKLIKLPVIGVETISEFESNSEFDYNKYIGIFGNCSILINHDSIEEYLYNYDKINYDKILDLIESDNDLAIESAVRAHYST